MRFAALFVLLLHNDTHRICSGNVSTCRFVSRMENARNVERYLNIYDKATNVHRNLVHRMQGYSIILSVASWSTIATKMEVSTCGRPSSLVREISYSMFSERDDDGTNLWRQIFSPCSLRYSYWTSSELHVPTLQRKFTSGSQSDTLCLILQQIPIL